MINLLLHKRFFSLLVLAVSLLLLSAMPLSAQINPGYDLLQTGSGSSVDLSSLNLGTVQLHGNPWDTSLGNTDTIMNRTDTIPSTGGSSNVNVTAIFMKSNSSVTYKNQQVDVYVTLNNSGGKIATTTLPQPDALSASSGSVNVHSDGTFDSSITVNADLIFVKAGTSVTDPNNYVDHRAASSITLTSSGSSWSSSAPSGYPSSATFPSGGGFYPRPVHTTSHVVVPASCGSSTSTTGTTGTAAVLSGAKKGSTISSGPTATNFQKACLTVNTVTPTQ
jgi:hypothetical protein